MKAGWKHFELENACSVDYGTRVVRKRDQGTAYPVYGGGGETFFLDSYNRENQLVIARFGMSERCTRFVSGKFFLNDSGLTVSPRDLKKIDSRFLDYLMISKNDEIYSMGRGTAQKNLNVDAFKKMEIRLPLDISEQKCIVAILDEAFAGIDQAIANSKKNLASARELFESYLNDVFTCKGDGWVETTIGDQITLQRGFDITKKEQRPGDVPVVSSGGIKSFHDETKAFGPGVVVGRKGSIGSVYFVDCDYWPHDTTLWVKEFKGNNEHLVYYLLKSLDLVHLDTGTANPALNRNLVHPLKISWPLIDRQEMIVDQIEAIEKHTAKLEAIYQQKLNELNELKQSFLQKAFSGELTADGMPIKKEAAA